MNCADNDKISILPAHTVPPPTHPTTVCYKRPASHSEGQPLLPTKIKSLMLMCKGLEAVTQNVVIAQCGGT